MNRWITAAQAADKLGFSTRDAFYKAVKRHGIPSRRIGRLIRFSDTALDAYMEMLGRRPIRHALKAQAQGHAHDLNPGRRSLRLATVARGR